ncbi:MAG: NAD(P)H-dependent oxidoreductase [Saccharospirillaceae bacterium]|nr:NAD(P)H-dependent oxidoreductase [Pseudomonadales bacterium]NRB79008.1 NAD(P)H-dependent oxidoreductase [Saccharospirillaceae bacterium]
MTTLNPLVLFAHPSLQRSNVHRVLFQSFKQLEKCTIQDLYELYPNFFIDIEVEQQLIKEHDVIVMQFPVYWFSMPALLKQWIDLVLESGFAFGKDGIHLKGKKFICVVSAGGSQDTYSQSAERDYSLKELFAPIEQMARYCDMEYLPPYVVYDSLNQSLADLTRHEANLFWLFENFDKTNGDQLKGQIDINTWLESQTTEKK